MKGKDIWMMGGGGIIASFLDEGEIDDFIVSVIPIFIGEGIPLIAQRHREVPLRLHSLTQFPDGVVQFHYQVPEEARIFARAASPSVPRRRHQRRPR